MSKSSARKSKQCPPSSSPPPSSPPSGPPLSVPIYLVPGRVLVGVTKPATNTPPIEELIEVDAMITETAETEYYVNPAVTVTLLEPQGCEFVTLKEARQNDMLYEFLDHLELDPLGTVTTNPTTTLRASVVNGDKVEKLNRGNSRTFKFGIKGRAGRDVKLKVFVTAQPVFTSCMWTVDQLNPKTGIPGALE
jgi:hypothetical protein